MAAVPLSSHSSENKIDSIEPNVLQSVQLVFPGFAKVFFKSAVAPWWQLPRSSNTELQWTSAIQASDDQNNEIAEQPQRRQRQQRAGSTLLKSRASSLKSSTVSSRGVDRERLPDERGSLGGQGATMAVDVDMTLEGPASSAVVSGSAYSEAQDLSMSFAGRKRKRVAVGGTKAGLVSSANSHDNGGTQRDEDIVDLELL
jgi:hypothetical protein